MRAVVQRVKSSQVTVEEEIVGKIENGIMVLLGVGEDDGEKDVEYLVEKILNLRIFEDENEKMNLSLKDIQGSLLVVSQFTLMGDCRQGRRPGFSKAGKPQIAEELYEKFIEKARNQQISVETGRFQTHMVVDICNDGPVTLLLDSKKLF